MDYFRFGIVTFVAILITFEINKRYKQIFGFDKLELHGMCSILMLKSLL
jgi:hypothetical protein